MIITQPESTQDFERYYDLRWRMLRKIPAYNGMQRGPYTCCSW